MNYSFTGGRDEEPRVVRRECKKIYLSGHPEPEQVYPYFCTAQNFQMSPVL